MQVRSATMGISTLFVMKSKKSRSWNLPNTKKSDHTL